METESIYIVYVTVNAYHYITAVNSSAFLSDVSGWVEIDRGTGDRFHHAQGNYFAQPVTTEGNAYRYKLVSGKVAECTPEEIREQEEANRPAPQPAEESVWDQLDAAYQEGVDSV